MKFLRINVLAYKTNQKCDWRHFRISANQPNRMPTRAETVTKEIKLYAMRQRISTQSQSWKFRPLDEASCIYDVSGPHFFCGFSARPSYVKI